jgi:hypothetical protein
MEPVMKTPGRAETRKRSKPDQSAKERLSPEDRLDEALDETFPASDPIAVHPEREEKRKVTRH